jgi:hypothetical protein
MAPLPTLRHSASAMAPLLGAGALGWGIRHQFSYRNDSGMARAWPVLITDI